MNLKPLSYNIFVADCIAGMKTLKDESIDLVVTSPPYNLGIKYTICNDKKTKQDYINWTKEWTVQVYRILHLDGSFFLNLSGSPSNPMMPFIIINELVENVQ
jgi:site-specific DNA-methyltransferase (adenine-specific)